MVPKPICCWWVGKVLDQTFWPILKLCGGVAGGVVIMGVSGNVVVCSCVGCSGVCCCGVVVVGLGMSDMVMWMDFICVPLIMLMFGWCWVI